MLLLALTGNGVLRYRGKAVVYVFCYKLTGAFGG